MFSNAITKIKEMLNKMGLIKSIGKVTDHKRIAEQEEMYTQIGIWKSLYKGFYKPFHHVTFSTLEGHRERDMNTLHMGKVAAAEMASLIYNEKCKISIGDKTVQEFIDDVLKQNKFDKNFQDYLEYSFAMGGMVIKPYIERGNDGQLKIMLTFVSADSFIPISWKNGNIYEALFPNEFVEQGEYFTHLEFHLWKDGIYTVEHELYKSKTKSEMGIKVSLSQSEQTKNFEPSTPIAAINRSLFVYIKPNVANNVDTKSPLGISLYANALDTMKTIDTAFDSFNREFRLGKKRIIVPAHFVKTVIDPKTGQRHRFYDDTDETYEAFDSGSGADEGEGIKDISTALRVDEHIAGINSLLNLYSMQIGFSSGTFSFDGQSMKTATEVISENSKTFKSKKSHEIIIEGAIQELVGSIVTLAGLYDIFKFDGEYEVSVSFDDSIADDKMTNINQQSQMVIAGLQSKLRAIIEIQGVTEEEALKILAEIDEEKGIVQQKEASEDSVLFGQTE